MSGSDLTLDQHVLLSPPSQWKRHDSRGNCSDDGASDHEDDEPRERVRPVMMGGRLRHDPRAYVESWLKKEAREADDLLLWTRIVHSRREPTAALQHLAEVHRRLLLEIQRRAKKQVEHEAALVLQFRFRRLLAESAAMIERKRMPQDDSRYTASRRLAETEVAITRYKSRASLQLNLRVLSEWRQMVGNEAQRLFERAGGELGAKVAQLRKRMGKSDYRQKSDSTSPSAKKSMPRERHALMYTKVMQDQEELVACEKTLKLFVNVMVHEFTESSQDESEILRGDQLMLGASALSATQVSREWWAVGSG